ncbi:MAG: glycosyltransferase, partial [Cyclobacteriaceae bacterium]|nr:glycosyltransferase [Cyclobacteriaceae bacterium]
HKQGIPLDVIEGWIKSATVEYLGTTKDVRKFIEQADCIVLPSYREGTPRTLLEASSTAKPIIATDVPGCHNVVDHNFNGLLCKLKDPEDLADKMYKMANFNDATLMEMGANGRRKMEEKFNEEIIFNKYLVALRELHPSIPN